MLVMEADHPGCYGFGSRLFVTIIITIIWKLVQDSSSENSPFLHFFIIIIVDIQRFFKLYCTYGKVTQSHTFPCAVQEGPIALISNIAVTFKIVQLLLHTSVSPSLSSR